MQIRILNGNDVRTALPMSKAIGIMKLAFGQFSAGKAIRDADIIITATTSFYAPL